MPTDDLQDRTDRARKYGFDRIGNTGRCRCRWLSTVHGDICPEHGEQGIVVESYEARVAELERENERLKRVVNNAWLVRVRNTVWVKRIKLWDGSNGEVYSVDGYGSYHLSIDGKWVHFVDCINGHPYYFQDFQSAFTAAESAPPEPERGNA